MRTLIFSASVIITMFLLSGQKLSFKDVQRDVATIKKTFDSLQEEAGRDQNVSSFDKNKALMTLEEFKKQQKFKTEDLDPDVARMMENINKEIETEMNPVAKKFMGATAEKEPSPRSYREVSFDFKKYIGKILRILEHSNETAGLLFFLVSCSIFLTVSITRLSSFSSFGLLCARWGFTVSRLIIILSAIMGTIAYATAKINMFNVYSISLLWGPFLLMISSAFSLKIYDFNNPVWNRMFFTVIWPLGSGLFFKFF